MDLQVEWIVGFVDGEGCFQVAINQNKEMTTGYQVLPEFTVVQHKRDIQVLHALKDYFKCGVVRMDHGDRMAYKVRGIQQLRDSIIPFFEKHSLKTKKRVDFQKFRKVLILMERERHLDLDGIEEIRSIKDQMDRRNTD